VADHLFAISNWWASQLMMGGFLHSVQGYMRALRQTAPEFSNVRVVAPAAGSVRVDVDDPEYLIQMLALAFDPKNRYSATDSRFSVRISDGSRSAAAPVASATVKSIREGDWAAEALLETALRASIAFWRPGTGWITTNSFKAAVRHDSSDHLVVGWRTYLGRRSRALPTLQLVSRSALPRGTLARTVPPGGVLVGLQGDYFDPSDPRQTDEAIAIRDGLRPHGLLDLPKDTDTIGRSELIKA
jgi:hypothetical protein